MSASVTSGSSDSANTTASDKTNTAMDRYTHCTFSSARASSKANKTYEPSTGATTVPMPLNACDRLMRISE